jgi:hypothetical protein
MVPPKLAQGGAAAAGQLSKTAATNAVVAIR